MGAMNFFRALGAAFLVAVMGAFVLAGLGAIPERGGGTAHVTAALGGQGGDLAHVFSWVFLSAAVCLAIGMLAYILMEEQPLRGSTPAATPAATPAE